MDKLISIIVPVYNAEKNIRTTVDSILNQTYTNIEVILVDDGSTDNSLEICEEQKKRDSRVRITRQKNAGVSSARNRGIEASRGDFLIFVDSDDYIEEEMIEVLFNHFTNQRDLVICGFYIHNLEKSNDITLNEGNRKYKEISSTQLASNFWKYYKSGITNSPCNKLYLASIIKQKNIYFPVGVRMGEDIVFNLKYFSEVNQIKIIDKYLYHYMLYPTQSTRKVDLKISNDMFFFLGEIEKFIIDHNGFEKSENNWKDHNYQIYEHLLAALRMPYRTNKVSNQERLNYITDTIKCFKMEFQRCTFFPQNNFDKLIIYYLRTSNYKKIHVLFRMIESTKYRLKLFLQGR